MAEEEEGEGWDGALIAELYKPPALLPIAQLKDSLLYAIETHPVTIIVGETGSGTSKQMLNLISHAKDTANAD